MFVPCFLLIGNVAGTGPICSDSDVEKLGSVQAATDVVVKCMGQDLPQQQVLQCISTDIPALSSVSRDCLLCTAAAFSDVSTECIDSCVADSSSDACVSCTTNIQNVWTAACNNKATVLPRLSALLTFVVIASLVQ